MEVTPIPGGSKMKWRGEILMFDKFGEFNSSAEINELAENLFNEGDKL